MSKRFNKNNLTRILHDIKEDYYKTFHEQIPKDAAMEKIIIDAAKLAKEGNVVSWERKNGVKCLNVKKRERFRGNQE